MKKFFSLFIPLAVILSFPFMLPKSVKPVETITIEGLRKHVFFLASDQLEGRLAGRGYDAAAGYAQAQFNNEGLKPLMISNKKKSWFQTTYLQYYELNKDSTILSLSIDKDTKNYRASEDFYFPQFGLNSKNETYGEAAFLGYGMKIPDCGWDDFKGIDLKNKWAFILEEIPDSVMELYSRKCPSEKLKNLRQITVRENYLRNAGAIGIVRILPKKMESDWDQLKDNFSEMITAKTERPPKQGIRPDIPIMVLHPGLVHSIFKNQPYDPISCKGIYQSFDLKNILLRLNKVYGSTPLPSDNVVAFVKGSDRHLRDEYITIGAHLDHLGGEKDHVYNGADDNASGCAAVIEIARAVAQSRPKRSVLFLLYASEEFGLVGSRYFINHSPVPVEKIKININLDMIGRPDADANELLLISAGKLDPQLEKLIYRINEKEAKIKLDTIDKRHLGNRSDQFSFYLKNIQNIFFTTGEHPDYHQPSDDAEKIDYDFLRRVTRLTYEIVMELANDQSPHVFIAKKEATEQLKKN